jgi:site-specific DNA-methyltransferase (adenine-specific)
MQQKVLADFTKADDVVLDLFGGSGSLLIACKNTNRTCYMMELDPKYCDVIRKRYAKHIGEEDWEAVTPVVTGVRELEHASR